MRNAATETLLSLVNATGMALTEDSFAEYMDNADPLGEHRASYHIPTMRDGTKYSYLAGNSLGLQHIGVEASIQDFLKGWREQALGRQLMSPMSWFETEQTCVKGMAALVGAKDTEVAIMNTPTANLHLLLSSFYHPQGSKKKIMIEPHSFPSDRNCLVSQLEMRGLNPAEDLIRITAPDTKDWRDPTSVIPTETFLSAIEKRGDETAIIILSAVQYLTGQWFDIPAIVKVAHAKNIIVGVDCTHAVGNVPLQLHDWEVDFACWCTSTYLSSGPGDVGSIFVHTNHTSGTTPLKHLKGWWGSDIRSRFSQRREFDSATDAPAQLISNSPAAYYVMLAPSLKLMVSVGMEAIRQKSLLLTAYLELLVSELVPPGCIEIVTPADPNERGALLSLRILPNRLKCVETIAPAYECGAHDAAEMDDATILQRRLLAEGVMIDKFSPDVLPAAPAPMYTSFADILRTVRIIASLF
ncbi:hypothetical protein JKF63_04274 [Porcisia hertigi]|uniref:Kynureninase n=1 Tax=Porcisia hertigi TaxID=2761500 RepID=A0A836ISM2_9TRYP|nr:hypothetical protein JKF63_04274 [Porcisia hertigi]